ncbi:MAG: acyl-CoA/acyl-ACP dehydrogenase, partial [Candidatus Helarchaeota archaeon]|nr:acyl-CoA/acyl-ACP dehydrogenase [Candidatus Helarchaeota archaeon]
MSENYYPIENVLVTEDEKKFRKEVREWVLNEVLPEADRIEHEKLFPRHLFKKMGERGYLKVLFPKSVGGTELGIKYGFILGEEIGWACRPLVAALDCTIFGSIPIMRFGTPDQIKKYLPGALNGDEIGAIAMTEPGAGSDVFSMKTFAEKDSNGDYIINGEKRFITNGSKADFLTLWCMTDLNVRPHLGMSAFIINPSFEGFEIVGDFELMGCYGLNNTYMRFNNMKVPKENLIGQKEGLGAKILLDELDSERTLAAASGCGGARRAIEIAAKHANERMQFGKALKRFEWVSFTIADMAIKLEAARNLTYQAACVIDAGKDASKIAAIAKVYATDIAFECANVALQICGGLGYMKGEYNKDAGSYLNPNGSP